MKMVFHAPVGDGRQKNISRFIRRAARMILCCSLAVLLTATLVGARKAMLQVHFIDVGCADAILIKLPYGRNMLIDAGGRRTSRPLAAYLRAHGVRTIERAIVTHPHANHFGGFFRIIEDFEVREMILAAERGTDPEYAKLVRRIKARGIVIRCLRNTSLTETLAQPGLHLTMQSIRRPHFTVNDRAVTTRLQYGKTGFLFLSDVGPKVQNIIIGHLKSPQTIRCVQIPHHGGKISARLAETFRGAVFVISTGKNPYGLPLTATLHRLHGTVWRTDRDGTLVLASDGESITVKK